MYILGFDIGGTKCAVITAQWDGSSITLLKKEKCDTDLHISPEEMIGRMMEMADGILEGKPDKIGVSCGGPLNSQTGFVLGPPNLPGWDNVPVVDLLKAHYGVPVHLQNDANACAVAEWKFGAGRGTKNMVFLTFGTGLGAGLILDGKLYTGTNDNAGECGHIRLAPDGPVGFGKAGSFEGFCSGGGIGKLGYMLAMQKKDGYPGYFHEGMTESDVTAKALAEAARAGDETAQMVYKISGEYLGRGLSVLIDILNPEKIVIGSVFARAQDLLWPSAEKLIGQEALDISAACCQVVPAELSENIGDYAAIATALL